MMDELIEKVIEKESDKRTIPVAKNHKIIVTGRAMIYRTVLVKLNSMKTLPNKPQANEVALRATHL